MFHLNSSTILPFCVFIQLSLSSHECYWNIHLFECICQSVSYVVLLDILRVVCPYPLHNVLYQLVTMRMNDGMYTTTTITSSFVDYVCIIDVDHRLFRLILFYFRPMKSTQIRAHLSLLWCCYRVFI